MIMIKLFKAVIAVCCLFGATLLANSCSETKNPNIHDLNVHNKRPGGTGGR
ncbi:hypothetical protein [Legionella maioricensis]|uniref:Lipoprotein n=1 Tax=Legionella maioricensis TaxID=2896528 RepID=A0A9X2CXV2_9GAMM|nr:hypothetical protein [Legionella maioricensis]MCL9682869.1 hypothetical protein [Legionella maioricensis]MCL9686503.1 hypothetical protein [Legionella maioricensis]